MTPIFAQTLDALSGNSGWAGAGLLGLVLLWLLLWHLPQKDKQIDKMINDKDKVISEMMKDHRAEVADTREDFKAALNVVVEHCEREIARCAGQKP